MPPEMKAIINYNKEHIRKFISKYMGMNRVELQAAIKDQTLPSIELAIATILAKGITKGDFSAIEWLMTRMIGKPDVTINSTVTQVDQLRMLPTPTLLERVGQIYLQLKAHEGDMHEP